MRFTQIRYFIQVAECLSFTEAAKHLYVSQQDVSKQISNLEKELDFKLLERTTKQVALTQSGKILYETWKEMLSQNDAAIKTALELSKLKYEKIRIGVAEISTVIDFILFKLEGFVKEYPNVDLEYEICPFKDLMGMLRNHKVDIIVSIYSELKNDLLDLNRYPLVDLDLGLELGIILAEHHPLSQKKQLQIPDLVDETLYVFSKSYARYAQENTLAHCKEEGFVPKKLQHFDNINSMELALCTGKGVAIGFNAFFRNQNKLKFYPLVHRFGSGQRIVAAWQDNNTTQCLKHLVECLAIKD